MISLAFAPVAYFWIPNRVDEAWFFSAEEKKLATIRYQINLVSTGNFSMRGRDKQTKRRAHSQFDFEATASFARRLTAACGTAVPAMWNFMDHN